jgi:hypothetical protein
MFGSNTIDIAIGLVSLFLLLSLMASATNELIEGFMKKRARNLARGIKELVGGDNNAADFLQKLYGHGLINSLFKGKYDEKNTWNLPSYIPSRNFALAVIDIVKDLDAEATAAAKEKQVEAAKGAGTPAPADPATTTPVKASLPRNIRTALDTLEAAADKKTDTYEKSVEDWYNSAMDRVSGWYKRRSQYFIFAIGLVLAIIANADCIDYAKRLSTDASLRQSVVAFAEATAKDAPSKDDTTSPVDKIKKETKDLSGIGLPIGWTEEEQKDKAATVKLHFLGWLLTALAVSLGAPFWFDMLNKIMVIRSTVKPHEKSKEDKSKESTEKPAGGK